MCCVVQQPHAARALDALATLHPARTSIAPSTPRVRMRVRRILLVLPLLLPGVLVRKANAKPATLGVAKQFIQDHLSSARKIETSGVSINAARLQHLATAYEHVPAQLKTPASSSLNLEFGVRGATSINYLAEKTAASGATWDGFDSFRGLPKTEVAQGAGWRAGAFTMHGKMPEVRSNVRLHAGWFNDTLPGFLDTQAKGKLVAFIHLDADIFESTWTVLEAVGSRCLLRVGTVLSFDELFAKKQTKLLQHEWRALRMASKQFGFQFRFISWMLHPATPYGRVAVQVTRVDAARCGAHHALDATLRAPQGLPAPLPAPLPALAKLRSVANPNRCRQPRRIFIDMGVNWCNTLQLYRELPTAWFQTLVPDAQYRRTLMSAPWQVYGFEASPLIVPYTERCARELSAGRPLPESPLPPMGSGPELMRLAGQFNCSDGAADSAAMARIRERKGRLPARLREKQILAKSKMQCILEKMQGRLKDLRPDPSLSRNPELLRSRVASAARCPAGKTDEFVMLPAAASTKDGTMEIYGSREDLITGGVKSVRMKGFHRGKVETSTVPTVDVVRWILQSFTEDDFVVLKMDIEGAEHSVVPALIEAGGAPLVDIFLWECHYAAAVTSKCHEMESALEKAGVNLVYREPYRFTGGKGARDGARSAAKTRKAQQLVASRAKAYRT